MKTIQLRARAGSVIATVEVDGSDVIGPETIRRGERIFIRRTHDVYTEATCLVVPE